MIKWRPSLKDLQQAHRMLRCHPSIRVRRRLKIIDALMAAPKAPLKAIARQAGTRTRVVRRLLQQWQADGPNSLVQFGRPAELNSVTLEKLKQAALALPLRSITEAGRWLAGETGINFCRLTLLKYCRQAGLDLPWSFKPPKPAKADARRPAWTLKQVTELKHHQYILKHRGQAVLQAGTRINRPLSRIARELGVPASTLRLDCRRFSSGGVKALLKHRRKDNRLQRTGVWPAFVSWCDAQWQRNGQVPPAMLARNWLRQKHQLHLPVRTVYTHLTRWRRQAGIPLRRHKPRDIFSPGEGLTVRAFRI